MSIDCIEIQGNFNPKLGSSVGHLTLCEIIHCFVLTFCQTLNTFPLLLNIDIGYWKSKLVLFVQPHRWVLLIHVDTVDFHSALKRCLLEQFQNAPFYTQRGIEMKQCVTQQSQKGRFFQKSSLFLCDMSKIDLLFSSGLY